MKHCFKRLSMNAEIPNTICGTEAQKDNCYSCGISPWKWGPVYRQAFRSSSQIPQSFPDSQWRYSHHGRCISHVRTRTHTCTHRVTWDQQTHRPQPPSGSCTERRYRTISSLYSAGKGIRATWHVIKRPVCRKNVFPWEMHLGLLSLSPCLQRGKNVPGLAPKDRSLSPWTEKKM